MTSILFLCTGNSCRSQMAEAWARVLLPSTFKIYSAGINASGLNPYAVKVMQEAGVDISQQTSDTVDQVPWQQMDVVVTVCGHADKNCPALPSKGRRIHAPFADPPQEAARKDSEDEKLAVYRQVRDEIRHYIQFSLSGQLQKKTANTTATSSQSSKVC